MGKSEDKKNKVKNSTKTDKSVSAKSTIPSDQKQTVQAVLNYLSSLGLQDVCRALEAASDLKAVRVFH